MKMNCLCGTMCVVTTERGFKVFSGCRCTRLLYSKVCRRWYAEHIWAGLPACPVVKWVCLSSIIRGLGEAALAQVAG